jgi:PIN domain nuclease of toxin-antitoxin system
MMNYVELINIKNKFINIKKNNLGCFIFSLSVVSFWESHRHCQPGQLSPDPMAMTQMQTGAIRMAFLVW